MTRQLPDLLANNTWGEWVTFELEKKEDAELVFEIFSNSEHHDRAFQQNFLLKDFLETGEYTVSYRDKILVYDEDDGNLLVISDRCVYLWLEFFGT